MSAYALEDHYPVTRRWFTCVVNDPRSVIVSIDGDMSELEALALAEQYALQGRGDDATTEDLELVVDCGDVPRLRARADLEVSG